MGIWKHRHVCYYIEGEENEDRFSYPWKISKKTAFSGAYTSWLLTEAKQPVWMPSV